jgi:hypothetical protein
MSQESVALLPTKTRINLTEPDQAEYYDVEQVAYVFRGGIEGQDRIFVATSHGSLGKEFDVGTIHTCKHDQSGGCFGQFTVIGVQFFKTGAKRGETPERKVPHYVFK